MSATIHSRIVDLDELIPRTVDVEIEGKDVEDLITSSNTLTIHKTPIQKLVG
ncbi:uncharacterized protein EURHEDRAFT_413059 [Aspergillus ruber CBS 135680]|uniref:Uncharacterized protein n=1 Tax=Aspergillus ruber (strain CBS 135680) TaxID=1388766 RepID=A0A017SDI1_ASPRC|nr:uncharacterized protein EURHEDRAFT_413059 [Aspergillus ruber CBS 135680]EYE94694.1 hypothetical protein EURHEDRAFT_413059 [Aspergillus ruber CBS 135680]